MSNVAVIDAGLYTVLREKGTALLVPKHYLDITFKEYYFDIIGNGGEDFTELVLLKTNDVDPDKVIFIPDCTEIIHEPLDGYCCALKCRTSPQIQVDGVACSTCGAFSYCRCVCKTFRAKHIEKWIPDTAIYIKIAKLGNFCKTRNLAYHTLLPEPLFYTYRCGSCSSLTKGFIAALEHIWNSHITEALRGSYTSIKRVAIDF